VTATTGGNAKLRVGTITSAAPNPRKPRINPPAKMLRKQNNKFS
jgi:hypothetical protein